MLLLLLFSGTQTTLPLVKKMAMLKVTTWLRQEACYQAGGLAKHEVMLAPTNAAAPTAAAGRF